MQKIVANFKYYSLIVQNYLVEGDILGDSENILFPFYAFAVEEATVGIHAIDHEGKTILYNKKMKEIEGLALEDVQDRSILELFNFDYEESTLLKVLQSEKPLLNVKQTYWNQNGIEITTINNTYPIFEEGLLIGAIELARDITTLEKFRHQPFDQTKDLASFSQIIAASLAMKTVISTAKKAAKARLPVLLIGETGNGKDLIAQSIHSALVPANSEFYALHGHRTDTLTINKLSESMKITSNCTLFCERIDLLSIPLQQQLLEFLSQTNGEHTQYIASIGDDPVALIAAGTLVKELYYFFASIAIQVPPLRERREDIAPFVSAYLTRRNTQYKAALTGMTTEVETLFNEYTWPGNIRELEFLLNEITSLATTETAITYDMLPHHFRVKRADLKEDEKVAGDFLFQRHKDFLPLEAYLHEAEVYYIQKAMKLYDGNVTKTAEALGMSRQSLQYRLRKIKK